MYNPADKAGWRVAEWCPAVGISRSAYYDLPPELEPASVKFGAAKIITESPADYLKRVAELQREAA